jgi:hypothetical protein
MSAVTEELDLTVSHEAMAQAALKRGRLLAFSYEVAIEGAPATRSGNEAWNVVTVTDMDRRLERWRVRVSVVGPPCGYVMSFLTSRTPEGIASVSVVPEDR